MQSLCEDDSNNSDGRLAICKTTGLKKRMLDHKKDEFLMDGKYLAKGDINITEKYRN